MFRELERMEGTYGNKFAIVNAAIYHFATASDAEQLHAIRRVREFELGAVGMTRDAAELGHRLAKQAGDLAPSKSRSKKRPDGKR